MIFVTSKILINKKMNALTKLTVLIVTLITTSVIAQDFQGVATYKTHRKLELKLDSTQMGGEMYERMMAQLKKQFEKTYKLTFSKNESIYKEEEQLEAPQPQGMQIVVAQVGGSDLLYKNTQDGRYVNQNDSFGKMFLIQDKIEKLDWQLGSETKNIGDYTCYKATLKREREVRESGVSINGDKEFDDTPRMEEYEVVAWYTPQIPVNNGPEEFHGLPGLILEINDGSQSIMCSKIVLNPSDKVKIVEPTKGKKISQQEYDKIMEKKMKEMRERYRHNREGDGQSFEIRIGG
jgi:GLPGLI family protein